MAVHPAHEKMVDAPNHAQATEQEYEGGLRAVRGGAGGNILGPNEMEREGGSVGVGSSKGAGFRV